MTKPGFALWLTGLPASGKTTIANELAHTLTQNGIHVQVLDSDELRQALTPEPTYSDSERDQFYRTLNTIAHLLTANDVPVIIAATGHKQKYRDVTRQQIEQFVEIYVACSLETCMQRDDKGIYKKAQEGKATTVPGLQVPYEAPTNPEITINTENSSPSIGVDRIMAYLTQNEFVSNSANEIAHVLH